MHEPIFSLLDTDLYKLTMMQCVFHQFPTTHANYRFISRKPLDLTGMTPIIQKHISALCQLRFSEDELAYLASLPYFKTDFINFLRTFRLEEKYIQITSFPDFELKIQGPWLHTILFEVPLLAIINESYYRHHFPHGTLEEGRARLDKKIAYLLQTNSELLFSDFGTRRRFSHDWQEEVIQKLSEKLPKQLVGTSKYIFRKKISAQTHRDHGT
jgi:nicotinate phosphoribosyltransferase